MTAELINKIEKLPKWAQDYIKKLIDKNEELENLASELLCQNKQESSGVQYIRHFDNGFIRINIPKHNWVEFIISDNDIFQVKLDKNYNLDITSTQGIKVIPTASNKVKIESIYGAF